MSTELSPLAFITDVADRAASREVDALYDFHTIGAMIVAGRIDYKAAQDHMVTEFLARGMAKSTATTYLTNGYSVAQVLVTFADVEEFADDECKGSRSLKAIYTAVKRAAKGDAVEGEGEAVEAETVAPTALVDVVLAGLANLKSAADIARVRDAAMAMLTVKAA